MEGKKIVYFYTEWWEFLEDFTMEQRGEWITYVMQYINDLHPELPADKQVMSTCKLVRNQLKRDLEEWIKMKEKRSEAGKKGMASRWGNDITNDNSVITADNDKVKVKVKVKDKVKDKDITQEDNACEREETQKLIENLEQLLGRVLTIAETETIISLRKKGYTRIQIYNEVKFYKDKKSPISYLKKKIENSQIQEIQTAAGNPYAEKWLEDFKDRHSKKEEIIEDTWMKAFNQAANPDATPEERIEAMKKLHPYEPDRWVDPLEDR